MDLVIDKVVQLQHIDITDSHRAVEDLAGTAICQPFLAGIAEACLAEKRNHIRLARAIKHRCPHRHTASKQLTLFQHLLVIHDLKLGLILVGVIDSLERFTQRLGIAGCVRRLGGRPHLLAQTAGGPAKMCFENLSDIHPRWHTQRVQHDIHRRTIFKIRHVFGRYDPRDHTLVAVTAGHLVTRLQLALHRDKDLDHLHHARQQLVTGLQLVDLVVETSLQFGNSALEIGNLCLDQLLHLVILDGNLLPGRSRHLVQHFGCQLGARLDAFRPRSHGLAGQQFGHTALETTLEDHPFVIPVLAKTVNLCAVDGQRTLVLFDTAAREDPHFDNRTRTAGWQFQRGVTDIGCFFTKDRAQQLFFRCHR